MKLVFSEYSASYDGYRFPYQVLGFREKKDNLAQVYYDGWLPFRSKKDWFLMSRSSRVRLSDFQLSSENRRILKKTDGVSFSVIPVERFEYTPGVQKFCKRFADERFGKGVMPAAAIRKILSGEGNCTHVMVYRRGANKAKFSAESLALDVVGYVGIVTHGHFLHYAHPFYDLNGNPDSGMGMMVRAVQWAKDQTKQFVYLGTVYGEKSKYKTQFTGFEFFNGMLWSDDLDELKYLISREGDEYLLQDERYRDKFLEGEWSKGLKEVGMGVRLK